MRILKGARQNIASRCGACLRRWCVLSFDVHRPVFPRQTLAKVIAAVLQFSSDQTAKVLEREQQRQTAVSRPLSSALRSRQWSPAPDTLPAIVCRLLSR